MGGSNPFFYPWWPMQTVYLPFVFAFGAIVGSFLNVVILRLPAGENLIRPRSHCPKCQRLLPWHENLPIIGWIRLRGRCRGCAAPISIQYPLIELSCALLFTAVYVLYYMVRPSAPIIGGLAPEWLPRMGIERSWPVFILTLMLLSSLVAMTVIDLRTFTIPIQLTWAVTIPAIVIQTFFAMWQGSRFTPRITLAPPNSMVLDRWIIPVVGPVGLGAGIGGTIGVAIGMLMLRANRLRLSFLDFDLWVGEDDDIIAYPFPRRELEWEIDFLAPVILGLLIGGSIGGSLAAAGTGQLPVWSQALGGSLIGYFVGGGMIWGIRILGTLLFGKEAMGLGDVHLLAAVGAVLGWIDPILIFFTAPMLALTGYALERIVRRFLGKAPRYIPYGPWLALATVVVMFGDRFFEPFLTALFRTPILLP